MEPSSIFVACLLFSWVMFLWERYLAWRQYRKYLDTEKRPDDVKWIIDEESFQKSRLYKLDRARFGFVYSVWSQLEDTFVLLANLLPIFWSVSCQWSRGWGFQSEVIQSSVFLAVTLILSSLLNLPWSIYDTFVIEEKHGFNKQTLGFFLQDTAKKLALKLVLSVPIICAVLWIIQMGGDYFFVYVWTFMSLVILFLMTIYPDFIAPLFDKYTLLPEGELRTRIEALAARLDFPLTKIYVVEGSKRSAHSNAYIYGFWNNKRIVLYDTILEENPNEKVSSESMGLVVEAAWQRQEVGEGEGEDGGEKKKLGMNNSEVLAVLGHEIGHWQLNHVLWSLVITEINLFLILFLFGFLYQWKLLYAAFGFEDSQPLIIGLLVVMHYVLAPYNELLQVVMTAWTRQKEFAADAFSAGLGYAELLGSALMKLGKDNLDFPVNDWLYSFWHHDHPPIPQRIEVLHKSQ